jgi:hypothetical protein
MAWALMVRDDEGGMQVNGMDDTWWELEEADSFVSP